MDAALFAQLEDFKESRAGAVGRASGTPAELRSASHPSKTAKDGAPQAVRDEGVVPEGTRGCGEFVFPRTYVRGLASGVAEAIAADL